MISRNIKKKVAHFHDVRRFGLRVAAVWNQCSCCTKTYKSKRGRSISACTLRAYSHFEFLSAKLPLPSKLASDTICAPRPCEGQLEQPHSGICISEHPPLHPTP